MHNLSDIHNIIQVSNQNSSSTAGRACQVGEADISREAVHQVCQRRVWGTAVHDATGLLGVRRGTGA